MKDFLEKIELKEKADLVMKELSKEIINSKEVPTLFKASDHKFPIVAGLIGDRIFLTKALNTTTENLIPTIIKALENPKPYNTVNDAPFLKNKLDLNDHSDLSEHLPVIEFFAGKKYTSSSIVIVYDEDEKRQNASFHRMMYLGGNKFAIRIIPQRHLDKNFQRAVEQGKALKVAIIFGVHPAIEIASAFSYPKLDELELASAFKGGLEVYELENGLKVPKESHFVLEARITNDLVEEGPFVDLTGTMDSVRKQPLVTVDRIYFRDNPIFRTILPGGNEHRMLMGIPQEPRMFAAISNTIPTVKNVVLTPGGSSWLHAVVQIKKRTDGDAKNAILAALAAHPSLKRVVIVDDDIDPADPHDVEWAISTRVQPDKDLHLVPGAKGSSLDPSANKSITCKWGIDATKPLKDNECYNKVL